MVITLLWWTANKLGPEEIGSILAFPSLLWSCYLFRLIEFKILYTSRFLVLYEAFYALEQLHFIDGPIRVLVNLTE